MSVTVTLTVEVGQGTERAKYVVSVPLGGDNDRFNADQTVIGTLRALRKILPLMPPQYREMTNPGRSEDRRWPPPELTSEITG